MAVGWSLGRMSELHFSAFYSVRGHCATVSVMQGCNVTDLKGIHDLGLKYSIIRPIFRVIQQCCTMLQTQGCCKAIERRSATNRSPPCDCPALARQCFASKYSTTALYTATRILVRLSIVCSACFRFGASYDIVIDTEYALCVFLQEMC